jgi:hypothetical protein
MNSDDKMRLALKDGKFKLKDILLPGPRMKELMMKYFKFKYPNKELIDVNINRLLRYDQRDKELLPYKEYLEKLFKYQIMHMIKFNKTLMCHIVWYFGGSISDKTFKEVCLMMQEFLISEDVQCLPNEELWKGIFDIKE